MLKRGKLRIAIPLPASTVEEYEKLKEKVSELEEENKKLKEKLEAIKKTLQDLLESL